MITVDAALARARKSALDRLDAQLLLGQVLRRSRTWLVAHGEAGLTASEAADFSARCARRAAGEPLAYLIGQREFHGLMLDVSPAVLVPRPDTETLVDWALELLAAELGERPAPRVIDLGTGSGAIALALKHAAPRAEVHAVERSPAALAVARGNASTLGLEIEFAQGDWWEALQAGTARFDLAVANPPYIAPDDPHLPALAHEPREALVAADDGLADLARIVHGAPAWLNPGGWLLVEHGWNQAAAVAGLLGAAGFEAVALRHDLAGRPRCSGARFLR